MLSFKQYKEIFDDIRDANDLLGNYCSNYKSNLPNSQDNECSNLNPKCLIVSKYINRLEANHGINISEGCKFLYNMMYDKYIKNDHPRCNMLAFYKASLQDYCVNGDWGDCKDFLEKIDSYPFDKYNNLMNLYNHFDKLVKSEDEGEPSECSSAGVCVDLYENYIQECFGGVNNYYCNELKNFKHDYETKIKELSCPGVATILTSAESNDLASIIIFGGVNNYYCNELKNFKHDYEKKIKELSCTDVPTILTSAESNDLAFIIIVPVIIISALCFISYIVNKVNHIFILKYISSTTIIF
ncbi:VIR protein [Plasmodium vivax]|uniref:VIR protein n=1 Tax=Plasmodium vivax TaxID=5855 RepID=A0A1G4E7K3_PLAVI|nr:VIR protein [Plasmodium vivax]